MRLIMAISRNGYVSRGPTDTMTWTGPTDKAVFKLLTSTEDVLAASAQTLEYMPSALPGRGKVFALSTNPMRGVALEDLAPAAPNAWLLGGQTIGLHAMRNGFVDQVYLCLNPAVIDTEEFPEAQADMLRPYLESRQEAAGRGAWWERSLRVTLGDIMVEYWRRVSAVQGL